MTITGMVIALGLLVDNAIVVTENISRFMRQGYAPFEAAVKGTGQIAWAIVSSDGNDGSCLCSDDDDAKYYG